MTVEESSFLLELAYLRQEPALRLAGVARLALPEVDVDALGVTWLLYAPDTVVPLDFHANLSQESPGRFSDLEKVSIEQDRIRPHIKVLRRGPASAQPRRADRR